MGIFTRSTGARRISSTIKQYHASFSDVLILTGGNSHIFGIFTSTWFHDPIWPCAYFSDGVGSTINHQLVMFSDVLISLSTNPGFYIGPGPVETVSGAPHTAEVDEVDGFWSRRCAEVQGPRDKLGAESLPNFWTGMVMFGMHMLSVIFQELVYYIFEIFPFFSVLNKHIFGNMMIRVDFIHGNSSFQKLKSSRISLRNNKRLMESSFLMGTRWGRPECPESKNCNLGCVF